MVVVLKVFCEALIHSKPCSTHTQIQQTTLLLFILISTKENILFHLVALSYTYYRLLRSSY